MNVIPISKNNKMQINFSIERFSAATTDFVLFEIIGGLLFFLSTFLPFEVNPIFAYLIAYILFLNKDFLYGRSFGKRILGQAVVDIELERPPSIWKCFIRNLLTPFFIIEIIFIALNPSRKIGDYLAATKVIQVTKQNMPSLKEDWQRFNQWKSLFLTVLASTIFSILLLGLILFLIDI